MSALAPVTLLRPVIDRRGPVLTTVRAAEYCGIAVQTLYNLLSAGEGPKAFLLKCSKSIFR